jgi:putative hydrolase of HD superfamily
MPEPELEGLTNFLYELGLLKRYKRTGWWIAGIDNPERIAEPSFRTAIIGYLLAVMEGADPAKTAALCLFHDTQATRIGDVPSVGKGYVVTAPNPEVPADQVAGFPAAAGQAVRELVEEYQGRQSLEVRLARDADKLECLIQAREYQAQGHQDVPPWSETSAAALPSASARRLAEACQQVPPRQWWKAFAESYPKPLKTAGRPPTEDRSSTPPRPSLIGARGSTQGLIKLGLLGSGHVLVTRFSTTSRPALRAAAAGGRPRPAAPRPSDGLAYRPFRRCDPWATRH